MRLRLGAIVLLAGGSLLLGKAVLAATFSKKSPPVPPWLENINAPDEWKQAPYWQNLGALQSKIFAAQTILAIHQNPHFMPKPSYNEFKSYYKKIGQAFGVPYELIRANHMKESYPEVAPLTLNDHSTALGLAQLLVGSCKSINLPYVYLADWRVSIWATAAYLKHRGWNRSSLPSKSEIENAAALAGTNDEPKWFKAQRGYWGAYKADHKNFQKSIDVATERLLLAIEGFDASTYKNMPMWNVVPNIDRLTKFFDGTAQDIDWRDA